MFVVRNALISRHQMVQLTRISSPSYFVPVGKKSIKQFPRERFKEHANQ